MEGDPNWAARLKKFTWRGQLKLLALSSRLFLWQEVIGDNYFPNSFIEGTMQNEFLFAYA